MKRHIQSHQKKDNEAVAIQSRINFNHGPQGISSMIQLVKEMLLPN
jgi:hypothetical protein